jgi:hypothetical protein
METASTIVYAYQEGRGGAEDRLLTDDWGLVSGWKALPFVASNDASASNISVTPGVLSPSFSKDVTSYTVSVPEGTTSVVVSVTSSDAGAHITGDGAIDVSSGSATAEIEIIAEDGTTNKSYTLDIVVDIHNGIGDNEAAKVSLYPNPVSAGKNLHLDGVPGAERLFILDMTGRVIFVQELSGREHEIVHLDNKITNGSYIVKISGQKKVRTQKLLIN